MFYLCETGAFPTLRFMRVLETVLRVLETVLLSATAVVVMSVTGAIDMLTEPPADKSAAWPGATIVVITLARADSRPRPWGWLSGPHAGGGSGAGEDGEGEDEQDGLDGHGQDSEWFKPVADVVGGVG